MTQMIKAALSSETCVKIPDTRNGVTYQKIVPSTTFIHFFEDDQRELGDSGKIVMEEFLELLNNKFW
jgi:hypothetical protein